MIATTTQVQPKPATNLKQEAQNIENKRNKMLKVLIMVAIGLFIFLIILAVLVNLRKKTVKEAVFPEPSITVTPPAKVKPTHPVYASDPSILAIEEKVRAIDQELINADIEEDRLSPPVLDLDINFEQ